MHQSRGLLRNRLGQMRVAMAEQIDGNAAGKIEVFLAVLAVKIAPLTAHRTHAAPGVNGHKRGNRHIGLLWRAAKISGGDEKQKGRPVIGRRSLAYIAADFAWQARLGQVRSSKKSLILAKKPSDCGHSLPVSVS